jgi:hypothetical protein
MVLNAARAPESMIRHVPGIMLYLVHVDSLLAMGVLAVVLSAMEWIGTLPGDFTILGSLGARLLWSVFFYLVARKASLGKLRLPVLSDFRDTRDALIKPLIAAAFATCWYWIVMCGFCVATLGIVDYLERLQASSLLFHQQGIVGYGLLALGMLYLPVALLGALSGAPRLFHHLDPLYGFRLVWRVPRAFSVTFAVLSLFTVVGYVLAAASARLAEVLPIPLAGPVLRHLLRLWVPLAQARLLGGFVHENRQFLEPRDVP